MFKSVLMLQSVATSFGASFRMLVGLFMYYETDCAGVASLVIQSSVCEGMNWTASFSSRLEYAMFNWKIVNGVVLTTEINTAVRFGGFLVLKGGCLIYIS